VKTFTIKIGKAWQVLRRDGFLNGFRRIFKAFFNLFKFVGSGDILFISGGVGDSALYRTVHVAEELEFNDFKCSVTVQDNPLLATYVNKFSVFIFHRTLYTDRVKKMIQEIKKQGKTIIFETDDLVYDPKYLKHMDYYKRMNALERKLYENGVGGEVLRDDYVKVATTTTEFLAEKLREEGKDVFVVPNKLSTKDVMYAADALRKKSAMRAVLGHTEEKVRLGYFSGAISHNKDFATITDALMQIMEKYDQVELMLVGPLDVEHMLVQKFRERIVQLPYVARKKHFFNVAQCDINLAPLELDNPFCEAKSELKFFEAGIVKVPTVAVANRTFSHAIEDGVDGFTAQGTAEWVEKLSRLINDHELRREIGEKACQKAMRIYTTKHAKNDQYHTYLREQLQEKGK
jgi:glycosyltransferase involved in cell wall biosynthesis